MKNPYMPKVAEIVEVRNETPDVKTFCIGLKDFDFNYKPGQFVELSSFGFGEIPVSITSTPTRKKGFIELSIKNVGRVTNILHEAKTGDSVGIRGPFGNGFPVNTLRGKDILFIGGGIGLAPLRSFINYIIDRRNKFGSVYVLYGARTYADMVFKNEYENWRKHFEVHLTIDKEDKNWNGNVGFVNQLLKKTTMDVKNIDKTYAIICGPEIMMKFVINDLKNTGFDDNNIILSLERVMKCGIGKCGHCNIGDKYVCIDGPVFSYADIKDKWK